MRLAGPQEDQVATGNVVDVDSHEGNIRKLTTKSRKCRGKYIVSGNLLLLTLHR